MPSFIYYTPHISELNVRPDDVLDIFREEDRSMDNPVVYETLCVFEQLADIAEVRGGYTVFGDIRITPRIGTIIINNTELNPAPKICKSVDKSEELAIFICTAGQGFSDLSKKYNTEGDYLKSYIADTFGSIVVEKAINFIQNDMEIKANQCGKKISNRYSPGYCNWDIQEQRKLFSLLPENQCRITLSESCLMQPIKSVSGIIGIGENVRKMNYACDICNSPTCIFRKVKQKAIQ